MITSPAPKAAARPVRRGGAGADGPQVPAGPWSPLPIGRAPGWLRDADLEISD